MKRMLMIVGALAMISTTMVGCKDSAKKAAQQQAETVVVDEKVLMVDGAYVSEGYTQREEGYDWVKVMVTSTAADEITIAVRSREDIKKPTCTLDAVAKKIGDQIYLAELEGKKVKFTFTDKSLAIEAKDEADNNILYYFCSGGASLRGTYEKVNE